MNTIASNDYSDELSDATTEKSARPVFRLRSAAAAFLRWTLMLACGSGLFWLISALWLAATGYSSSFAAWRARPACAVASEVFTAWMGGLWLLRSTRHRWPQFWSQADALHGFGITASVPYRRLALGAIVGLALVGAEVLTDRWLLPRHAVEHSLFALAEQSALLARMVVACSVVTIVPLVEEVMFRGVLLTALLGYGLDAATGSPAPTRTVIAVALTSVIFALMHGPAYAWHALPLAWTGISGMAMACVRLRTRSLWPAVALHATVNGIASLGLFVTG